MLKIFKLTMIIWAILMTTMAGAMSSFKIDYGDCRATEGGLPHMYFEESGDNLLFEEFLTNLDGFSEE